MTAERIERFTGAHAFLSNFFPIDVAFEGLLYSSVEHAYQAAKTTDEAQRIGVQRAPTAGQAKQRGRALALRADWENVRVTVMLTLLRAKFPAAATPLSRALVATGASELVEGNTWGDTFWGVCRGVGHNYLGLLLMQVRDEIRGAA